MQQPAILQFKGEVLHSITDMQSPEAGGKAYYLFPFGTTLMLTGQRLRGITSDCKLMYVGCTEGGRYVFDYIPLGRSYISDTSAKYARDGFSILQGYSRTSIHISPGKLIELFRTYGLIELGRVVEA